MVSDDERDALAAENERLHASPGDGHSSALARASAARHGYVRRSDVETIEEIEARAKACLDNGESVAAAHLRGYAAGIREGLRREQILASVAVPSPKLTAAIEAWRLVPDEVRQAVLMETRSGNVRPYMVAAKLLDACAEVDRQDMLEETPANIPVVSGLSRDMSTPENRAFWAHVEKNAAEVATWPEWKKVGIAIVVPEVDAERAERQRLSRLDAWDKSHAGSGKD